MLFIIVGEELIWGLAGILTNDFKVFVQNAIIDTNLALLILVEAYEHWFRDCNMILLGNIAKRLHKERKENWGQTPYK